MKSARTVSALLLALPLIVFGGNYFRQLFDLPEGDGSAGDQLLQMMRDGGPGRFQSLLASTSE